MIALQTAACAGQAEETKVTDESSFDAVTAALTDREYTAKDRIPRNFGTVGYYAGTSLNDNLCRFWVACGIDTIELLDIGWYFRYGEPLDLYVENVRGYIEKAHSYGLKIYIILLTNLEQWRGEAEFGNGQGKLFNPNDEGKMAERLSLIERNIAAWSDADGFSLFAGDPGGVLGLAGIKNVSAENYIQMVRDVYNLVRKYTSEAEFNANIWAVSQWDSKVANPTLNQFWVAEDKYGSEIIRMADLINEEIGIEIPGHDYYRPLAIRLYVRSNNYPETPFPSKEDTDACYAGGTTRVWGFSHFLLDELDDGDTKGKSRTELPSINTRYIKKYIDDMENTGMNGVIAGTSSVNNALNLYAFSRFADDSVLTPEDVLYEYASYLVEEKDVQTLVEIFKFLENDTNWHQKMPKDFRLADFDTVFSDAGEALEAAKGLTVLKKSPFSLPENPVTYINKIINRIEIMID